MAAYAALVSLINTITMEQIPHHTRHFNSAETEFMESLSERAAFLQELLEREWKGTKDLESRIADAAQAAEDAIESKIVDLVISESTSQNEKGYDLLCQDLQKAIEDMDSIKIEAMQVKENSGVKHQDTQSLTSSASLTSPSIKKNRMVAFQNEKSRVMEELASNRSSRQVIPIVGMGGSGKTTLARNIYDDKLVVERFDIRAWVTVSQEYNVEEILKGVLSGLGKQSTTNNEKLRVQVHQGKRSTTNNEKLQVQVHQYLSGRRYLIVLDDIWSVKCWYEMQRFFPDSNQGSRIIITTRLSNLANKITHDSIDMKLLDDGSSWKLFCEEVFEQGICPPELEEIGRKITLKCRGLPLALVVIGGFLKKSSLTLENWERVAKDVDLNITSNANDPCFAILHSSYNYLPIHLKPCFLYMGVFPEDHEIRVSKLCKLWIAEGFLRPIKEKSFEEIAEDCVQDLIMRNLILVDEMGKTRKVKSCKIHDLLRELSIREALKEKFLYIVGTHNVHVPPIMSSLRRIVVDKSLNWAAPDELLRFWQSTPLTRSLTCARDDVISVLTKGDGMPILTSRLLRVVNGCRAGDLSVLLKLVNSRCIDSETDLRVSDTLALPSTICHLRNLKTLGGRGIGIGKGRGADIIAIALHEVWDMPQLMHIKLDEIVLPNPTCSLNDHGDYIILKNLHTLKVVKNFRCSNQVVKKIPNIRKLKINFKECEEWPYYCLENLKHFENLESLSCILSNVSDPNILQHMALPSSLKKLLLGGVKLLCKDMSTIGVLPHLEVLYLEEVSFEGGNWNPNEEEFVCLKVLCLDGCNDLVNWNADSSHFPRLEELFLVELHELKEIPLDIGDVLTLRSIMLYYCADSVVISAKKIQEAQESLGNEVDIQVVCYDQPFQYDSFEDFLEDKCRIL